jgi:nicotinamide-nucleotide amidase
LHIEIINTGSELLLGAVLNTHQQWLCRQLANHGYLVERQVAVADSGQAIEQAVREALARADCILTTGGLGPTSDDLTRDRIAALLNRPLHEDARVLAHLEQFFQARRRRLPPSARVQTLVPEGALVLANAHGTAPGLLVEVNPNQFRADGKPSWLVMLPGPPRELYPMFTEQVLPLLREKLPLPREFVSCTLRSTGIGESAVEETIAAPLKPLAELGLEVGYCARVGEVDVRLSARGERAASLVNQAEDVVRRLIGKHIFGSGDDSLETVVVRLLTERQQTLALAESCTGGLIAHRITNVPGASAVLRSGLVTYSNEAKRKLLGVRAETLAAHGEVSQAVAREMAEGARVEGGTDYALAVTGIAGPTGGSPAKPIGTVFIALATAGQTVGLDPFNPFDRETFKFVTSQQALELLRRELLATPGAVER